MPSHDPGSGRQSSACEACPGICSKRAFSNPGHRLRWLSLLCWAEEVIERLNVPGEGAAMKMPAAVLVFAGILVVGALFLSQSLSDPSGRTDGAGQSSSPLASSSAYGDYSPEAVSSASDGERVVLFFHAQWCATCKLLSDDISANVDQIPQDVRILVVDFDSQTALKQKYGVTQQHTLVQVTRDGDLVAKWSLSRTLDDLISRIS